MFSELVDSHLDCTESVSSRRTFCVGPLDFRVSWTLNTLAALNSKFFVIRDPSFVFQSNCSSCHQSSRSLWVLSAPPFLGDRTAAQSR